MNKKELLARIGDVSQIGGVRDFTFNDGKMKGVRALEINTGVISFTVLPDRCMDIAQAFYKGEAISWISKTGITSPEYYDRTDKNFLRGFFGGLVTTCGLKNIGKPYLDQGQHGRIANTPAEKVSVFADWVGDDYVIEVSGIVRECAVFGENLVLKRTIKTKLFSDEFTLEDTIINEGFEDDEIALCYHCNFGYPLVNENAVMTNVPADIAPLSAPIHGKTEECIKVPFENQDEVTVGIKNEKIFASITYKTKTLPNFLIWKMMGESEYVVGLEPRTTNRGGENIRINDEYVTLKPFEEYKTYIKFKIEDVK